MEKQCIIVRKFLVVGNWKMNGDKCEINVISRALSAGTLDPRTEVVLALPAVYMRFARDILPTEIALAGQNAYKVRKGAFTGEISPAMLKDCCARWVILGHSERRQIFNESDELIGEKCAHALAEGLKVIACICETSEDRKCQNTREVIARQMRALANHIENWTNVVVAYEPLWAKCARATVTPLQAEEVHCSLRKWLACNISQEVSDRVRLIYGGPVNAVECSEFAVQADIDGFLVDNASTNYGFVDIINAKLKKCKKLP